MSRRLHKSIRSQWPLFPLVTSETARREAETSERRGLLSQEPPRITFNEEEDDQNLESGLREMGFYDAINGFGDSDFGGDGPSSQPENEPIEALSRAVTQAEVPVQPSIATGSTPRKRDRTKNSPDAKSLISTARSRPISDYTSSYETDITSLPALQVRGAVDEKLLEPVAEEDIDPGSFDLVAPQSDAENLYSLEARSELMFSKEHLMVIFADPSLLLRFTAFLSAQRSSSIPILIYYLDAVKALKAINYANAIAESLQPISEHEFTTCAARPTVNAVLEEKAREAFEVMVYNDLPAYITYVYVQTVSISIAMRITGTLPPHLRQASEGLAEVFCLTDISRPDNPIVFASEEFHRTTQYGMNYVIGRNCRFLQGPKTDKHSVKRLREMVDAGREHCEVFLNYRRDGSPFMNLLIMAPLRDSRGTIRYFIGAQVDVSGLVKECSDLESLERLIVAMEFGQKVTTDGIDSSEGGYKKDEFQQLSEMMDLQELEIVRRWGGRMHRDRQEEVPDNCNSTNWNKTRVLIREGSDAERIHRELPQGSGILNGVYENYLLVRPYPSLKILFASPSMRVPGILQSSFMSRIGGNPRVREELTQALADGRGVTAKIRWVTRQDREGRSRWIHCTSLLGSNGAIGVWMVVIVDGDKENVAKKYRQAPPVDPRYGSLRESSTRDSDINSLRDFAIANGGWENGDNPGRGGTTGRTSRQDSALRSVSDGQSDAQNLYNLVN